MPTLPPRTKDGAIKKFGDFLYRACIHPASAGEDARRREYILNIILTGSILMLLALDGMIFYHTILHWPHYIGVAFIKFSSLPLLFVLLLILSRRGYFVLSSYLLIAALFTSNSYAAYTWGGDLPVVLLAYAFIIYAAGILVSTSFGFAMTALTACLLGTIWHLQIHGIVIPHPQYPTEDDVIVLTVFYFLIMAVSWLSNHEIEKSLARARRSESALKDERDLLEVRVAERTDELRQTQFKEVEEMHRFAAFGQLASGLFHDLLNLLNAISLRTEGNAEEETSLAAAYSTTRQIKQFMYALQKQLGEKNVRESFSLIEGIEQAIQLIAHKAKKESVGIFFDHHAQEPLVYSGVSFKFHQVVINLLSNAIDSYLPIHEQNMPEKRVVSVYADMRDGMFTVAVKDNGCGIPETAQKRIFEPFFTTKNKARGSGIGLATIKKIVEEDFCGTIGVKSLENNGSVFTVTFPVHAPSAPAAPPHQEHEHPESSFIQIPK